jgi:hypothetical protein
MMPATSSSTLYPSLLELMASHDMASVMCRALILGRMMNRALSDAFNIWADASAAAKVGRCRLTL